MPSTILSTTIQATILRALANLTAQLLIQNNTNNSRFKANTDLFSNIDIPAIIRFAFLGLILSPLNVIWQGYLEENFPVYENSSPANPEKSQISDDSSTKTTGDIPPKSEQGNAAQKQPGPKPTINYLNLAYKLILDQTLGQAFINATFIIIVLAAPKLTTTTTTSQAGTAILATLQENLWKYLLNAWKLWPFVALFNFLVVPVQYRVLVISLVGFGWNIWLSLGAVGK